MKGIILAAGQGSRMGSETDDKPKCMITYKGKPLINYTIDAMRACGIKDIIIVNGYKKDILVSHLGNSNIRFITNENYKKTNMVYTLFCTESEMNDDLVVSYSDIIFKKKILETLINDNHDFIVTVDRNWLNLWQLRMDNPLLDAETMKIDSNGNIIELGQKPSIYEEIEGQYIGLFKVSKSVIDRVKYFYNNLDKSKIYDGKDFNNMYMTSFIQLIIDSLFSVKASLINSGWLEFDSQNDLTVYKKQQDLF